MPRHVSVPHVAHTHTHTPTPPSRRNGSATVCEITKNRANAKGLSWIPLQWAASQPTSSSGWWGDSSGHSSLLTAGAHRDVHPSGATRAAVHAIAPSATPSPVITGRHGARLAIGLIARRPRPRATRRPLIATSRAFPRDGVPLSNACRLRAY